MAGFIVEQFGGIAPKVDPRQLLDQLAQTAQNCRLDQNALHPVPDLGAEGSVVGASDVTLYEYQGTVSDSWLSFSNDRNLVKVPIANDDLARIAITNPATYPTIYSDGTDYRLGIPAPSTAITFGSYTGPSDANALDAETISYVMTFVDAWGAEGPPSAPSEAIDRTRDTEVNLVLPAMPAGDYNFGVGALKRIYRSNTGSESTEYQFVAEVAYNITAYADNIANEDLAEILPSADWVGPPDDDTASYPNGPMIGIVALPNGVLAGFAHNVLCLSEPFLYHAWPFEYRISFEDPIVSISPIAAGLAVITEKRPYMVTGVHPGSMATIPLDINQACVAKRSMVDMGDYAIYASPDGLVAIEGGSAKLITEAIFTREQWQALSPTTISAYRYEGKYVAFTSTSAGFIFDPRGGANSFVTLSVGYEAAYYDPLTDILYVNDAGTVKTWEQHATNKLTYTWKSKKFMLPKPANLAVVMLETWNSKVSENVTLSVWADGSQITGSPFTLNTAERFIKLPGGFRAKVWEFQVSGINPISRIGFFESMEEAI